LGWEAYEELGHWVFFESTILFHEIPKNISNQSLFSVFLFAHTLVLCEVSKPSRQVAMGASQSKFPPKRNALMAD
jgi:hypothetical protein